MKSYTAPVFLAAVLAVGSFGSPSFGSDSYCGEFELVGGAKTVTLIDSLPNGPSIGDIRTGVVDFTDPRNDEVVKLYYRSKIVVVVGDDGIHTFQGNHTWAFPDGDLLFVRDIYERTNDTEPRGTWRTTQQGILGGTGVFARASGTVGSEGGDAPVWRFDLQCD